MYPYERLAAWQVAYQLTLATYRATASFPKHELYGLTSQSRRAAVSVVANAKDDTSPHADHYRPLPTPTDSSTPAAASDIAPATPSAGW
jgi:hypothetical protein